MAAGETIIIHSCLIGLNEKPIHSGYNKRQPTTTTGREHSQTEIILHLPAKPASYTGMRHLCFAFFTLSLFTSAGCASSPRELFNSHDFAGWEFVATPAADIGTVCKLLPGGIIAANGTPVGYVATTASYQNYRLHAEWRWTGKAGNSGILIHLNSKPSEPGWPLSIQMQMKTKFVGDLMPMAGATFAEPLEPSPKNPRRPHTAPDSEKAAGEWNTCDIVSRNGTIEVTINGVLQNKVSAAAPSAGRIGFQFEGDAFELRQVRLVQFD